MSEIQSRAWLSPVVERERILRRRRATAMAGFAAAAWGLWIWWGALVSGRPVPMAGFGWLAGAWLVVIAARWWARHSALDLRSIARRVEADFPDLDGRLITALEPFADRKDRLAAFFRQRLENEVRAHLRRNAWQESYRARECFWLGVGEVAATAALAGVMVLLVAVNAPQPRSGELAGHPRAPEVAVEVSPGDVEVEQGTKLLVEARFPEGAPSGATLEWLDAAGEGVAERFEMRRSLDDPVFGAVIPRVERAGRYRIAFPAEGTEAQVRTEPCRVGVFVHPRLERADVTVRPPAYAGQPDQVLEDVSRVSALEGSELRFRLRVNKPVAKAELTGEDGMAIPLKPDPGNLHVLTADMRPEKSQRYELHLADAAGRPNKQPAAIQVQIRPNQRPKLELSFPGKDVDVSALQEMAVEGKVWDDLGVERLAAVLAVGEHTRELVLLAQPVPGKKKQEWRTQFPLEEMGAQPGQLVSYHLWAEDKGPDGGLRRTESELFLAEVRDWRHTFREAPSSDGKPGEETRSEQLRKQQKDIISATWNLKRRADRESSAEVSKDAEIIQRSQDIVKENLAGVMDELPDPGLVKILGQAADRMEQASGRLRQAAEQAKAESLSQALQAEQAAYQFLLQAEGRETQVTRSRRSQAAGGGETSPHKWMDLELKQESDRYETERQAQTEAGAQGDQEANLEVLRRLKELARREEAVAQRLQELGAKLEEAKTAKEKEELDQQLKRLREEQEELLRDVDQLAEQMDGRQDQEPFQEARDRLAAAREQVRRAGEELRQERLAESANAAGRAKEEMNKLEEAFRQRTANRFAGDLRQMRGTARDLARQQQAIGEQLEQAPDSKSPFDQQEAFDARRKLLEEFGGQRKGVDGFLESMRQVSEQAETAEPALATALYEAVRRAHSQGLEQSLDEAVKALRYGDFDAAIQPERAAARAVDQLQRDVEEAAESVLGSEAEALRRARAELERLAGEISRELGTGSGEKPSDSKGQASRATLPRFFEEPEVASGPLTGGGYSAWADGMRRVEDLLENPELRSELSRVLDRAREFRIEARRNDRPPQWDLVQMGVVKPLAELGDRVTEELARLEKSDPLVPIDRDPVPGPYRELVRKYYEKLARGR